MKACVEVFLSLEVERDGGEPKRESQRVSKVVGSTRLALCGHSTRLALLRSLDSLFVVTRLALCGYSSWISLSQILGLDRSLAVTWIDLSRSLDSLSCGHSTFSLRLLVMDSSLVVTRRRSFSRSPSDRSLAVT